LGFVSDCGAVEDFFAGAFGGAGPEGG